MKVNLKQPNDINKKVPMLLFSKKNFRKLILYFKNKILGLGFSYKKKFHVKNIFFLFKTRIFSKLIDWNKTEQKGIRIEPKGEKL